MKRAKSDTQPSPHFLMESATVDYVHADIRKLASALSSGDIYRSIGAIPLMPAHPPLICA
ncbi:MAG: hypothetical protein PHG39_10405 [Acidithiobacillus ferrooxidans]|nr:hypothetical protein [Acidithiobacillus ferrooxidans]MDD5004316.1 hypothetical protein [Acidithiobacillus sp.]MDD5379523.1 hypothetical protein [Acidithiobacillus sp.]MDD5576637.1 hypothetical protein [Acidithiobacillus sp.]